MTSALPAGAWKLWSVTLKALANSSPGPGSPCGQPARGGSVALWQPWEHSFILEDATLKELCRCSLTQNPRNSFRVAKNLSRRFLPQGFKANPGLELANAFSVTEQDFHTALPRGGTDP